MGDGNKVASDVSVWIKIRWAIGVIALMMGTGPVASQAASLAGQDVQDVTVLGRSRGHSEETISRLLDQAKQAADQGLPERPIVNKIKEGLAKGVPPERIQPVVREMVGRLREARDVLREVGQGGSGERGGEDGRAAEVMAEALGRGVTVDEIRSLGRSSGKGSRNGEALAFGAKGLALTKEAGLSGAEGVPVIGEALRQGFRSDELLDLGREIKKHGHEFRSDRQRFQDIKKAVERGERPDKIFERDRTSGSGHGGSGGKNARAENRDSFKGSDRERSGNDERSDKGGDRDRVDRGRDSRNESDFSRDRGDRGGSSGGHGRGGRDD